MEEAKRACLWYGRYLRQLMDSECNLYAMLVNSAILWVAWGLWPDDHDKVAELYLSAVVYVASTACVSAALVYCQRRRSLTAKRLSWVTKKLVAVDRKLRKLRRSNMAGLQELARELYSVDLTARSASRDRTEATPSPDEASPRVDGSKPSVEDDVGVVEEALKETCAGEGVSNHHRSCSTECQVHRESRPRIIGVKECARRAESKICDEDNTGDASYKRLSNGKDDITTIFFNLSEQKKAESEDILPSTISLPVDCEAKECVEVEKTETHLNRRDHSDRGSRALEECDVSCGTKLEMHLEEQLAAIRETSQGGGLETSVGTGKPSSAGEAAVRPEAQGSSRDRRAGKGNSPARRSGRRKARRAKRGASDVSDALLVVKEMVRLRQSGAPGRQEELVASLTAASPESARQEARRDKGLAKHKTAPVLEPRGRVPGTAARCPSEGASKGGGQPPRTARRDLDSELKATIEQRRKEQRILADMWRSGDA